MSCAAQRVVVIELLIWVAGLAIAPALSRGEDSQAIANDRAAAIECTLSEKSDIDATNLPLVDLVARLRQRHGIEIVLDEKALADAGVDEKTTINRHVSDVTLRSALGLTLDELDLTFVIWHEVLLITTKTEAENVIEPRVYPVGGLVSPDADFIGEPPPRMLASLGPSRAPGLFYGELIELITSAVRPDAWDDVGGPLPLRDFDNAKAIVVPQTQQVHEEIAQLLRALRAVREKQRPAVRAARRDPVRQPAEADNTLQLRVYSRFFSANVGGMGGGFFQMGGMGAIDLAGAGTPNVNVTAEEVQVRMEDLARLVPGFVAVETWENAGGNGRIRAINGRLVVLQSATVHRQVEEFLEEFSGAQSYRVRRSVTHWEPGGNWPCDCEPRPGVAETAIEKSLGQRVELLLDDVPLGEVIGRLNRDYTIPTQLDAKALADYGIGGDTKCRMHVSNVSLASALALLLDRLDLTCVVRNEVLFITTKTEAENILVTKAYPAFDLVAPSGANYGALIEIISCNLSDASWDDSGGAGTIKPFNNCGAIVVSQTQAVHRELERLLAHLRQARRVQQPQP
jgi:hypothetical protein